MSTRLCILLQIIFCLIADICHFCYSILELLYLILIFIYFILFVSLLFYFSFIFWILKRHVTTVTWCITWYCVISLEYRRIYLSYRQYINFIVELFIISIDYILLVYSIEIYWGLLVKFSCDFHKNLLL